MLSGMFFRWGGDEFFLLLKGSGGDHARQTAEKLRPNTSGFLRDQLHNRTSAEMELAFDDVALEFHGMLERQPQKIPVGSLLTSVRSFSISRLGGQPW